MEGIRKVREKRGVSGGECGEEGGKRALVRVGPADRGGASVKFKSDR